MATQRDPDDIALRIMRARIARFRRGETSFVDLVAGLDAKVGELVSVGSIRKQAIQADLEAVHRSADSSNEEVGAALDALESTVVAVQTRVRRLLGPLAHHADSDLTWADVERMLSIGTTLIVRVFDVQRYGVFVDVGMPFPGLIFVDDFKHDDVGSIPAIGDRLVAIVTSVDAERQRMYLKSVTRAGPEDPVGRT
jgi:hypothetical protein